MDGNDSAENDGVTPGELPGRLTQTDNVVTLVGHRDRVPVPVDRYFDTVEDALRYGLRRERAGDLVVLEVTDHFGNRVFPESARA